MSTTPPSTPPSSPVFSMRIVTLDYYMSAPIPGLDFCESPCFQGRKVEEVPVVRIYGSTVAGQKTCLHVHRAFPYLYIPCLEVETSEEGQKFIYEVSKAIERGLQGTNGSKKQHVHGCSLVRAKKFYGYHSSEDLFLKIYLYRPTEVARAAALLLSGSVLNRSIQPYESHIPFLLQFMIDCNLYGMGLLRASHVKFRQPLPEKFLPREVQYNLEDDSPMKKPHYVYEGSQTGSSIWLSSTVPESWTWNTTDGVFLNDNSFPTRQSICELEGDSTTDDILNQSAKIYTSFSQSNPDAKMVQSLVPIWEEEVERSGLQDYVTSPNIGKPSPDVVLRSMCDGFQYESGLSDVFSDAKKKLSCKNSPSKSSPDIGGSPMKSSASIGSSPLKSPPDKGGCLTPLQNQKVSLSEEKQVLKYLSSHQVGTIQDSERKVSDDETLGLLSWLTSSQAINDDILDDELLDEDFSSSQRFSSSFEKAVEKANLEYEISSQQECQDILDTLKGFQFADQVETSSSTMGDSFSNVIPQVDGSSDEQDNFHQTRKTSKLGLRRKIEMEMAPSPSLMGREMKRSCPSRQVSAQDNELNDGLDPHNSSMMGELIDVSRQSVEMIDRRMLQMNDAPNTVPDVTGTSLSKCSRVQDRDSITSMASSSEDVSLPDNCVSKSEERKITSKTQYSGFIAMTLNTRPPVIMKTNEISMNLDLPSDVIQNVHALNWPSTIDEKNQLLGLPPFFSIDVEDRIQNYALPGSYSESIDGIPLNFQNDGSFSYLLTFSVSPPSRQSVFQWLLGQRKKNVNLPIALPRRNCSSGDVCESSHGYDHDTKTAADEFLQKSKFSAKEIDSPKSVSQDFTSPLISMSSTPEFKLSSGSFCDISQISGQKEKTKFTPLSQIGFRDPASSGHGQNLTILSLEIQSESRGSLLPDPKFDAIKLVSVVIQEDNDHDSKSYILLYSNDASHARNLDGISGPLILIFPEERLLYDHLIKIIRSHDPDILLGWDVQGGSLGHLAERAGHLGIHLLKSISRTPVLDTKVKVEKFMNHDKLDSDTSKELSIVDSVIIDDEWGRNHASGIHVGGRMVLNVWRLMRSELRLNLYTVEAVAEEVLRRKVPFIPCSTLNDWFSRGSQRARFRCIEYTLERAKINLEIMNQLDMVNRTSELARVFGIDFFSVLSRGSQFRVESMLLRLLHSQNYVAISPGYQQVASQPAMECLPLVMEPESGFYADPVVVLDFQSLYPSMIIAYNLCYSTCLGKVLPFAANRLGVSSYSPNPRILLDLKEKTLLSPNGVMYVSQKVRKGVVPCLLDEILSTRIMVKKAMKKLTPSQQVLQRILNARQLALKLIANVTYGYTAAGFSGRMPCAELADSIVQCGRKTLENSISFINSHHKWKARVVYGDTDSMFVLLQGRSREEAFEIGREIALTISSMNPEPVLLKMEKVYHPCFLLTKKRYVGYSYENPNQAKPSFDAKGIETIRRDTCPAVSKTLERSLRLFFEQQDVTQVKQYLQRQWGRILSGRVSLQDFVFAKEVRLGSYSTAATASLPPAAIIAMKAMRADPRREPRYGERVPYVVVNGEPGARLVDMVVEPFEFLEVNSPHRLNDLYYINKQIIPALQRVFGLLGVDLNRWFSETPRLLRPAVAKRLPLMSSSRGQLRSRIDRYYLSKNCTVCGNLINGPGVLCDYCAARGPAAAAILIGKTSNLERNLCHLSDICRHCGGGDWIPQNGVKCTSLACSVFFERRKVQKELLSLSSSACEAGFYPRCPTEWF